MRITAINPNKYITRGMSTKVSNTISFKGFWKPCQPVKPDATGETPAPNPGLKGAPVIHVVPTDEPKTGTLNILA